MKKCKRNGCQEPKEHQNRPGAGLCAKHAAEKGLGNFTLLHCLIAHVAITKPVRMISFAARAENRRIS